MDHFGDQLRKSAEKIERALEDLLSESQPTEDQFSQLEQLKIECRRSIEIGNQVFAENFFLALRHFFDWGLRFARVQDQDFVLYHLVDRGLVISVNEMDPQLEVKLPQLHLLDTIVMPPNWLNSVADRAQIDVEVNAKQIGFQAGRDDFWVFQSARPEVFLKYLWGEIQNMQQDFLKAGLRK